jgi:hypothetical protein
MIQQQQQQQQQQQHWSGGKDRVLLQQKLELCEVGFSFQPIAETGGGF